MTSKYSVLCAAIVILALALAAPPLVGQTDDPPMKAFQERTYEGKPITFWLQVLRDHNDKLMGRAFQAIQSLDEDAWVAVPDLTGLIAAPFAAIQVGQDSPELMASKVYDIAVRTEAIETLAWIGPAGARSTSTLVEWALTERVVRSPGKDADDRELFIELVTLDAEQKMRVAGAVASFGQEAFPIIARLLTSSDAGKRKLGVAILSQDALPIAAELLRSRGCADRGLGLRILKDMDLVVSAQYLDELASQIRENCAMLTKVH